MVKRARGVLLDALELDHASSQALSAQIYYELRDKVFSGALKAGDRLPASRMLARELSVSRTTVVEAYERLIAEGAFVAKVGAGTFVSDVAQNVRSREGEAKRAAPPRVEPRLSKAIVDATAQLFERIPHKPRAFTTALPAFDVFPIALWSRQVSKHWRARRDSILGYGDPSGYLPLRRAIATHLKGSRGVICDPDQVFIVGGAQQAFYLIARLLTNPGDDVWFENPGAIGARNCFAAVGANLVPVPVDRHGLDVAHGVVVAPSFRLAFVTPSHQQPLGVTMSLTRRAALIKAAEDADAMIVEDDYDGEFCYSGAPTPALKSIDASERVIYVGTFSKTMFPSLRLGFIVAPQQLVDIFAKVSETILQGVPSNPQAVVADFIEEGHFASHVRRMRKIYAERRDVLLDEAGRQLSGSLDVANTETGLHTIGLLASGYDEVAVSELADKQGVSVAPISRFSIEPTDRSGFVLGFSGVPPNELVAGVETLARVLRDWKSEQPSNQRGLGRGSGPIVREAT